MPDSAPHVAKLLTVGQLPRGHFELPWDALDAPDPVVAISNARRRHGDTFSIVSGGTTYVFVFGTAALRSLYDATETTASKGLADYQMLLRKLPNELFMGRRTFAHDLFGASDVKSYLPNVDAAIDAAICELVAERVGPVTGSFDAFEFARRLGHRIGINSWFGREAPLDRLIALLDVLDGAEVFVHPSRMVARDGDAERQAMRESIAAVTTLLHLVDRTPSFLDTVAERWADSAPEDRHQGIAYDLILLHIATMTNLFAAIGWALTLAAQHPDACDDLDRLAFEAIRLGQRSIISRQVLKPCEIDLGTAKLLLEPAMMLATMAPVTNRDIEDGDVFDPQRWANSRLHNAVDVVTFGHGVHRCPAQRFSMQAITRTVREFSARFELSTQPEPIVPLPLQVGGMARPHTAIQIRYRSRSPVTAQDL